MAGRKGNVRIVYIDILADINRAIDGGMVEYIEVTQKEWTALKAKLDMQEVLGRITNTFMYRGVPIVILDR